VNARLALLAACACVACHSGPAAPALRTPAGTTALSNAAASVTLVFAASTAGQLVPCGCSPDQRGGLPRAVSLVKKLRAQAPGLVYVDAGDLLFESAVRKTGPAGAQAELKARTLAAGEPMLGAAARALGPRDLAAGAGFLDETRGGVPLLDGGGAPVRGAQSSVLVDAGGVPVGLFAAGLGDDPPATIAARAAQLRKDGARLVVLLAVPRDPAWQGAQQLQQAARSAGVDLVVLGRRDDPATDPDRVDPGPPPILAVEGLGQSLLRVDVKLPAGTPSGVHLAQGSAGKAAELKELDDRIARLRQQARTAPEEMRDLYAAKAREVEQRRAQIASAHETVPPGAIVVEATFLPLTKDAGEDAAAKELVARYDADVAEMNLRLAKQQPETCPPPEAGEPAFTAVSGPQGCASCHETEARFWVKTGHAHAYETLVLAHKQFSLDCVRCHVTGWQQPGGVCRIDRTAAGAPGFLGRGKGRQDVQCEMCHGPGSAHADDPTAPIQAKVPVAVCVRCHEAANSPHFDDVRYRPYVIGPGHGDPLARGEEPHPRASGSGPNAELKASAKTVP
jgi:2',3'-cyclic-nucleotide 2'-phosphodiesterase (5'-nucleotidase family)